MTSANVTNYRIEKDGKVVYNHSQHHFCHTRWHRLLQFIPFKEYTITPYGLDEEEEFWEGETKNLKDFMDQVKFSFGDIRRMCEYAEKQNKILKEWADKFGDQDPKLRLTTLNSISYSPL